MTNQFPNRLTHPLTDGEILDLQELAIDWVKTVHGEGKALDQSNDEMFARLVYDRIIQRSIKWMRENLGGGCYLEPVGWQGYEVDVESVVYDFRKDMFPQEKNNG